MEVTAVMPSLGAVISAKDLCKGRHNVEQILQMGNCGELWVYGCAAKVRRGRFLNHQFAFLNVNYFSYILSYIILRLFCIKSLKLD